MKTPGFGRPFAVLAALALVGGAGRLSAQSPPEFSSVQVLTNKDLSMRIAATAGQAYRLETSSDLAKWSALATFRGAASVEHIDSAAPYFGGRYYRVQQLADAAAFFGDHLPTSAGDTVIRPLNHASFVLQWNGLTIYGDPVAAAGPFTSLPKADLILVTHNHGDHFDSAVLNTLRKEGTIIVAPGAVYSSLSATLKLLTVSLANGGQTNVLGIPVEAVPAYNSNHPKGTGNGYVVTLGNRRLYISGDTGDIAEMRALTDIDVAFVCMNQPYTMTVAQAANAVRVFRPRIVYPYHYRNQDGTLANLNSFKSLVNTDLNIEVRLRKWY
jgi:L-ascorbate metabolism protein UlaG (beta-lactamase superfamily)